MPDDRIFPLVVKALTTAGRGVVVVQNHADLVEAICACLDLYPAAVMTVESAPPDQTTVND